PLLTVNQFNSGSLPRGLLYRPHHRGTGKEILQLQGHLPGPGRSTFQRLRAAAPEPVIPAVERPGQNAEPGKRSPDRQGPLPDQADDLQLLGTGVSHCPSPPYAIMSSSACCATTSFNARASRRRSVTSLLVAARAVSPARRRLPASRNPSD